MKESTSNTVSAINYATPALPAPANYKPMAASAAEKRYKYLRRLFKFNQMDFEFAAWQMVYLFIAPQKVFQNSNYRKYTKSQFARDDPAFLVLLSIWLVVSTICFGLVLDLEPIEIFLFVIFVVFVDFIGLGILFSTFLWYASNKFLRRDSDGPDVEWAYAFDVHINAFFPPLALLHCFQIILYSIGVLGNSGPFPLLISNSFWLASIFYYLYITFLGYSNLPILHNTKVFLLHLPLLFITFLTTLAMGWNISDTLIEFYRFRLIRSIRT
ncbi:hypothetical protein K1T71_012024 [Dendrolimus kikuchii]|uniref:Uncharacterized protein n=1 Tax=Dendrolimus kikuchii TaxID=765133 RepID=A0ACC1CKE1_9NEOP|nr:hypothetical protein K1T71_012024 [Dendrolimus kikuchii]